MNGGKPDPDRLAEQEAWSKDALNAEDVRMAGREWFMTARAKQYPLPDAPKRWLVVGGRGSGKTRLGAEWVHALVLGLPPFTTNGLRYGRIALVAETLGDAREVMVAGDSGILGIARGSERPRFETSRRRVLFDNGATAQIFSSEDPDALRGPQFDAAWCDELAKWNNAEHVWDMLQFGLRLGEEPRQLVTTTPRATALVKRLMREDGFTVTRMRTSDNAGNLAPGFLQAVTDRYAGTRLGRQELDGELIEDRSDALWSRNRLEAIIEPVSAEALSRIVVAVDPPASANARSDACGIVAAGTDLRGGIVVLADASVQGLQPDGWAARAVALYHSLEADLIVAEVNQGGAMVESVIRTVDPAVPVKAVRASRGKWLRAEPVAALYAQGRVGHAAHFPELVDEMCDFGPSGLTGNRSPDRVDALVWAIAELMNGLGRAPRVRGV